MLETIAHKRGHLSGARIWLSGAIPEDNSISKAQCDKIEKFVKEFSRYVFEHGGHIIHGSHPSFVPILLEEARTHQEKGGHKDVLTLAVSHYWSKNKDMIPVDDWRKNALVYETPESKNTPIREKSLDKLRTWIAERSDAIVIIGGKWYKNLTQKAGVPIEFELAKKRKLPCFILGGFGGITEELAKCDNIFLQLKNGFDIDQNINLALNEDIDYVINKVCKQLELLPLVHGKGSDGVSFRILSLDGGGLKGTFSAAVLAAWEEHTGLRIVDHFDLIAGTSTGGIIALALGLGLSAQQILNFYITRGDHIFPNNFYERMICTIRYIFRPKYSQTLLLNELENVLYENKEKRLLKDSCCRLIIPAYHAIGGVSHIFRTPHNQLLTKDGETPVANVALATSAAPTYFAAAKITDMIAESNYFDGGVWANSPALAAVVEATCFLQIPLERIDLLSVGTTSEPFSVRKKLRSGLVGWLSKKILLDLLLNVQQESSLKLAKNLVGNPKYLRVNTITQPGTYKLDCSKNINELADLGKNIALNSDNLEQVKSRFLNGITVMPWKSAT